MIWVHASCSHTKHANPKYQVYLREHPIWCDGYSIGSALTSLFRHFLLVKNSSASFDDSAASAYFVAARS